MTTNKKPTQTVVLRGAASFAKILGDPVLNYNKDGKEWKMDLQLTDKGALKELKALGISDKVKQKETYLNGDPHLTFKQSEFRKNGKPNFPIRVVDITGAAWPQEKLIGNGSIVDVKFVVMDHGVGKNKGMYIRSVRVVKLETYAPQEFDAIAEDDEFFNEVAAAEAMAAEAEQTAAEIPEVEDTLDDDLPM